MYYRNSGKFSIFGFALALVIILIGVPVLGFIYSHALWYIPIIYLNFLISIFFGIGVGSLVAFGIKIGKIRNTVLAFLLGLLAGAVALYTQWVFWLSLVANAGEVYGNQKASIAISYVTISFFCKLIVNPHLFWELILSLNQSGSWGIRNYTPTGLVLWVIWAIEATIVLGFSFFWAISKVKNPYCEASGQWAKEVPITKFFKTIEDRENFVKKLEQRDYSEILALSMKTDTERDYAFLSFFDCPGENYCYLSINNMLAKKTRSGEIKYIEKAVVKNIMVDRSIAEQLLQKAK